MSYRICAHIDRYVTWKYNDIRPDLRHGEAMDYETEIAVRNTRISFRFSYESVNGDGGSDIEGRRQSCSPLLLQLLNTLYLQVLYRDQYIFYCYFSCFCRYRVPLSEHRTTIKLQKWRDAISWRAPTAANDPLRTCAITTYGTAGSSISARSKAGDGIQCRREKKMPYAYISDGSTCEKCFEIRWLKS